MDEYHSKPGLKYREILTPQMCHYSYMSVSPCTSSDMEKCILELCLCVCVGGNSKVRLYGLVSPCIVIC